MNKKLALFFIFPFSFFIFSCASSKITSVQNETPLSVRLAPDVSLDMLSADYWIQKTKNPYKIRMTRSEIALWNRANEKLRYPSDSDFAIVTDLRKIDSVMTSLEIRGGMLRYPKNPWYKKVNGKGGEEIKALSQKDWRAIFENMNISALESMNYFFGGKPSEEFSKNDFPVRKAICVRRGNLRLVPDDTFFSDDKDYWFDDCAQNSGILTNEPVLVLWESADKNWLFVKTSYCTGWIHASDVAFCSDEEFFRRFDYAEKNQTSFVTVTADRFSLSADYLVPNPDFDVKTAGDFFMGTYLFTADWNDERFSGIFSDREPYASFLVEIPFRKSDGSLGTAFASIPAGVCSLGLLDYTSANVLNLAFKPLGNRYGWGGMAQNRDCSEYLKDIFRCFGFNFARNSRSQLAMSGKTLDFEGKSPSKKASFASSLEAGTPMGFPGHVFLYLGKVGGKHFVISALGAYYFDESHSELIARHSDVNARHSELVSESLHKVDANSVSINTLDMKRKTGDTWLEMLTQAKLLLDDGTFSDDRIHLNQKWQFAEFSKINSGESILYRSQAKNRKNITIAVNAGHGTKGGSAVKTFSHPDKSPKLTGGTNAAGAIESIAVSDGMIFKDGKRESEVNLRTARLFKNLLLKNGYDVLMIRDSADTQLDNIARTVIANNNAALHIAIHFDGDNAKEDKGVFYCSIPEGLKSLPNVKKHWRESERLGACLIEGLKSQELTVYNGGKMEVDLTQTSFSTIPTVDIELGNQHTLTQTTELEKRARGLLEGVELFFNNAK